MTGRSFHEPRAGFARGERRRHGGAARPSRAPCATDWHRARGPGSVRCGAGGARTPACHSRHRVFIKYHLLALVSTSAHPRPRTQASPISPVSPSALLPALPSLEVSLLERSQHGPSTLSVRAFAASPQPHTHTHVPQRCRACRPAPVRHTLASHLTSRTVTSPLAHALRGSRGAGPVECDTRGPRTLSHTQSVAPHQWRTRRLAPIATEVRHTH